MPEYAGAPVFNGVLFLAERFFVSPDAVSGGSAVVTGEDHLHLSRVLRAKKGDRFTLCDGCGHDYAAVVDEVAKDCTRFSLADAEPSAGEPSHGITLYQCLCKGDRMDWLVQKAVETGAVRIVPVISERCVAREADDKKLRRLQRIAMEAAKQCGRGIIPEVCPAVRLSALPRHQKLLFAWEEDRMAPLSAALDKDDTDIALLIGPEGGLSEAEAETLRSMGGRSFGLGKRILRAETAGPVSIALILHELGEF